MQQSDQTVLVTSSNVLCDGGIGALGHPRIFMTMPASGSVECPYCGKRFVLDTARAIAAGH